MTPALVPRLNLLDKQHPSEELPPAVAQTKAWFLRYDVSPAPAKELKQRMVREGGSPTGSLGSLPDRLHDCGLKRAFHDELGVRKVVFSFCDDLLQTAYRLPAWTQWGDELEAVFASAGVRKDRVVRCLLAELGPGVDIPVHHDTGYWATRTHRVHVPLTTDALVEFYTGARDDALELVRFPEFGMIELNNRAKHMVKNKWDQPRVHLIFDFCEEHDAFDVRELDPARDVVTQTRRTIAIRATGEPVPPEADVAWEPFADDERRRRTEALMQRIRAQHGDGDDQERYVREFVKWSKRYINGEMLAEEYVTFLNRAFKDDALAVDDVAALVPDRERARALASATRPWPRVCPPSRVPRFVIVGAMKAGTTSLYEYVNRHPRCVYARQKEPHALDWVWDQLARLPPVTAPSLVDEPGAVQALRAKYLRVFPLDKMRDDVVFSGEATPSYCLGGSECARRLRAAAPGARLIFILRDPVERAYSHYRMTTDPDGSPEQLARRGSAHGKSFSQVVADDLHALKSAGVTAERTLPAEFESAYLSTRPTGHGAHSFVGRGLYALQLELIFRVFPRDQVHVMRLEDLSAQPQAEMDRVFDFLHVPRVCDMEFEKHNVSREVQEADAAAVKQELAAFYAPFNKRLARLLGDDGVLRGWTTV